MTYIDSFVLNLIESLCRRFQLLTGRTNVWLAVQLTNLSIVMYFVWVLWLYLATSDLALRVFVSLFCGGVLLVLSRTLFRESVEAREADAYRRVQKGLVNPRRLRDTQLRISFLTLSVLLGPPMLLAWFQLRQPIALLTPALIILTTVVLYVLACDPLPPCVGKVTEWARGFARLRPVRVRA